MSRLMFEPPYFTLAKGVLEFLIVAVAILYGWVSNRIAYTNTMNS